MLKDFIPPYFLRKITSLFYGWSGNYSNWNEAKKKSTGYDSTVIIDKVKKSLMEVKSGRAVFERDSVLFDKKYYSFPLLSALSLVAIRKGGKLNVLDFGGSLGSSYFQNSEFYADLETFNWCIVEQKHFVEEGIRNFEEKNLHFFYDIPSCISQYNIDLLLLSSVIQYIESPYQFLEFVLSQKFEYIMIDRTPLLSKADDRIAIQKVPGNIYKAKYPSWLLNKDKLIQCFSLDYELVFEQITDEKINVENASFNAFLFKLK